MALQRWRVALQIGVTRLRNLSMAKTPEDRDDFKRLFDAMSKEANRRLSKLEQKGYTYYAYNLAGDFIKNAFGENAKRYEWSDEDNRANYQTFLSMRTFVSKKTSTIKGMEAVNRERVNFFREKMHLEKYKFGAKMGTNRNYVSNAEIIDFLKFLGEKPVRTLLKEVGKGWSEELVEDMGGQLKEGDPNFWKDLLDVFRYYMIGKEHPERVPQSEQLYYNELRDFLKNSTLPDRIDMNYIRSRLYYGGTVK